MISFLSSWAKNIGLAIVIISILEMILPNNKTKKYVKMVMGIYILFCIISPFVQNKINLEDIKVENYTETSTASEVNQTSMDERIETLYIEQMEKDITKKVEEKGYKVNKCKVDAQITQNQNTTKINKITLKIQKDTTNKRYIQNESVENKIVSEVQKIRKVETDIGEDSNSDTNKTINKSELQELKKYLEEEYGVSEQCLVIN